jgi:hypothetical protein
MKTILTLILFTFSTFQSFSQDILTYKNGKTQKVIVLTTNENDVTCQDFETKEQFTISRSFLSSVQYQEGKVEPFGVILQKKVKPEPINSYNISFQKMDTIHYQNGYIYYKGANYAKPREIRDILLLVHEKEVSALANAYKTNIDLARVFATIGGAGMGWTVGGLIGGKKFDVGLFLGGAGVAGVGFLFNAAANKNLRNAISLHNRIIKANKVSWKPILYQNEYNQTSIGIALNF